MLNCNLFLWSKLYFQHYYSLQCHMTFRNHNNILICWSRNISDYYHCLKSRIKDQVLQSSIMQLVTNNDQVLHSSRMQLVTNHDQVLQSSIMQLVTNQDQVLQSSIMQLVTNQDQVLQSSIMQLVTNNDQVLQSSRMQLVTNRDQVLQSSRMQLVTNRDQVLQSWADGSFVKSSSSISSCVDDEMLAVKHLTNTNAQKKLTGDQRYSSADINRSTKCTKESGFRNQHMKFSV